MSAMKSDEEMTDGIVRMVRALGRRCAMNDPDSAAYLRLVREQLDSSLTAAVNGWRRAGYSDAQIGRELGVTKQAVQKRWPRELVAA